MIDFSACVETLFLEGDRPLDDRVRAAADSGFRAVEIWGWWDKDLARLARALDTTDTQLITLCVESWKNKCDLGDPSSHDEFLTRVRAAAEAARQVNTPRLVVLAGDVAPGIEPTAQVHNAVAVLARAGEEVSGDGPELLVEVVDREHEGPNALISGSRSALSLLGRHEFGTGTIDWATELAWLQNAGYEGYVGIEATPLGDSSHVYATARALL
ncbi:TIM barrel protein [Streptomyces sp. SID12488]|uniref:TIM barrel protein n=1 Tax=Streptomyces sp. SID12488 TaxID=2706040 RepID=UPI0013DA399A|nr:TIM barrel protein [Streptomyces sp. SID12488]NEA64007.1 TIM barrel protein [Streptomyces sp. SID12488]